MIEGNENEMMSVWKGKVGHRDQETEKKKICNF